MFGRPISPDEPASLRRMKQLAQELEGELSELERKNDNLIERAGGPHAKRKDFREKRVKHDDPADLKRSFDILSNQYDTLAAANDRMKATARRRMESYLRRESYLKEELEDKQREIEEITLVHGQDTRMEELRRAHRTINHGIETLQDKARDALAENEEELTTAFTSELMAVNLDMQKLGDKSEETLKWRAKAYDLGKELDWVQREALRLDEGNQRLLAENSLLRIKSSSLEEEKLQLARHLAAMKKKLRSRSRQLPQTASTPPAGRRGSPRARDSPKASLKGSSIQVTSLDAQKDLEIRRLQRQLQSERDLCARVRMSYADLLHTHRDLKEYLHTCWMDARVEARKRRDSGALTAADRDAVLERFLQKEEVVSALKDTLFPDDLLQRNSEMLARLDGGSRETCADVDDGT